MRERPILFSGPMVREILAGRKTQTRRPVKPQPGNPSTFGISPVWGCGVPLESVDPQRRFGIHAAFPVDGRRVDRWLPCPYGAPGDRLWVRETFARVPRSAYWHDPSIPHREHDREWAVYREGWERSAPACWKPSIHMPRWASRITLEVTSVRVERLQAITEEDARAEGFERREHFLRSWTEMYGGPAEPLSVEVDPWVWVVTFRRVEAP